MSNVLYVYKKNDPMYAIIIHGNTILSCYFSSSVFSSIWVLLVGIKILGSIKPFYLNLLKQTLASFLHRNTNSLASWGILSYSS